MEKNYNIKINPPRLTDEQVARHKDFDALLEKYHQAPASKPPILKRLIYLSGAIAASAALLFLVFQGLGAEEYPERQAAYFAEKPFIDPPLENVSPQFTSYKVNANEGGVYEYPSGSKLVVPSAAFAMDNGDIVSGEVTLHYREMHDFIDFFLSGIPMTYDSAGTTYNLESAGMIELFAEQDGKRVNMAPGKSIDVQLVSHVNVSPELIIPQGYNIYKLDKEARQWEYREVDRMQLLDLLPPGQVSVESDSAAMGQSDFRKKLQTIEINLQNELNALERTIPVPDKPIQPQKAIREDHVFDLDFDDLKDPDATGDLATAQDELASLYKKYERMLWQLSPASEITPEQLQREFSEVTGISIRKLNARDYELILEKNDRNLKVVVNPVLTGTDYEEALTDFNRDFERWESAMAARENRLAAQRAAIEQRYAEEKRLAELKYDERIAELRSQGMDYSANQEMIKRKVVNRFRASELGIWNCDRPLPPEVISLEAEFVDENGNKFENLTGYLVDKNRNTVYRFLAEDGAKLRFNTNSENLMWIVTTDNKIAVFRPDQFDRISKEVEEYTFTMEVVDKIIRDEEDVREVLYL